MSRRCRSRAPPRPPSRCQSRPNSYPPATETGTLARFPSGDDVLALVLCTSIAVWPRGAACLPRRPSVRIDPSLLAGCITCMQINRGRIAFETGMHVNPSTACSLPNHQRSSCLSLIGRAPHRTVPSRPETLPSPSRSRSTCNSAHHDRPTDPPSFCTVHRNTLRHDHLSDTTTASPALTYSARIRR